MGRRSLCAHQGHAAPVRAIFPGGTVVMTSLMKAIPWSAAACHGASPASPEEMEAFMARMPEVLDRYQTRFLPPDTFDHLMP
ncbi:MAG: hypothetical protein H0U40_14055 [Chloroflexia bacterium]|nr:hypothetical protein [Chloroflexia bacterium]